MLSKQWKGRPSNKSKLALRTTCACKRISPAPKSRQRFLTTLRVDSVLVLVETGIHFAIDKSLSYLMSKIVSVVELVTKNMPEVTRKEEGTGTKAGSQSKHSQRQ